MQSATNLAYVNPDLLSWARERRGLSYERTGKAIGVTGSRIEDWENGSSQPTFNMAIRLANVFRVPLAYFYLRERPPVEIPLPDLRRLSNAEAQEPSVDFLELLFDVIDKQTWYREHLQAQDARELDYVSRFTIRDRVEDVAADIREVIGIGQDLRTKTSAWTSYLTALSGQSEAAGILVMRSGVVGNNTHRPLSVKEFQGFAITDKLAPLIFVNSKDFKTAQIFTLAHELAHIWIGKSGVSKVDEAEVVREQPDQAYIRAVSPTDIETYCNAVAAETLVPRSEMLFYLQRGTVDERLVAKLARHFFVSTLVILRRARELDALTTAQFIRLLESEKQKQSGPAGSGGDYYRNLLARHGHKLTDAVISEVRHGHTSFRDGARLLDLKVPTFENFIKGHRD